MTICALLLARQFYDLEPEPAPEVRDARPAVRQRLDRRHADALRGAAGADGGAAVGLGHAVHAQPLRLARGAGDRRLDAASTSSSSGASFAALAARPPVPDVEQPDDDAAPRRRPLLPVPAWLDARPPRSSWPGRSSPRTIRRSSSAAFCSSSASRKATAAYQSRIELQGAAARRLLPRRPRHPRRPAGLVDRAGAGEPVARRRCSSARRC